MPADWNKTGQEMRLTAWYMGYTGPEQCSLAWMFVNDVFNGTHHDGPAYELLSPTIAEFYCSYTQGQLFFSSISVARGGIQEKDR
jgi:hypothetical protein